VLNIDDVYQIGADRPYTFDREVDESLGYRTKSMLVLPLENREGTIRGVLQLINRKADPERSIEETEILSYPDELLEVVEPFSYQAAVALERAELDESIQSMIHSMIQALVNALDKRDKITTGHSRRVAAYGYHLARAVDRSDKTPWTDESFDSADMRRLYYAGLLHDIGKIAVPEDVLNKQNRLKDEEMETLYYRLAYFEEAGQLEEFEELYSRLCSINESGYLEEREAEFLDDLHDTAYHGPDGELQPVLEDREYRNLSVKRGNLTDDERNMIESHAKASFEILRDIDWTTELGDVPTLAASHHERLDGSGYPWGRTKDELSLIARILAVVDVYEALTARDRPYRSAMDHEQARDILLEEADAGNLDARLIELFLDEHCYECDVDTLPELELA
jgi:HD-GYP domain-containing protein (c-di-GMP phosphodiesterase class II)